MKFATWLAPAQESPPMGSKEGRDAFFESLNRDRAPFGWGGAAAGGFAGARSVPAPRGVSPPATLFSMVFSSGR